jgi:hypothetical protein
MRGDSQPCRPAALTECSFEYPCLEWSSSRTTRSMRSTCSSHFTLMCTILEITRQMYNMTRWALPCRLPSHDRAAKHSSSSPNPWTPSSPALAARTSLLLLAQLALSQHTQHTSHSVSISPLAALPSSRTIVASGNACTLGSLASAGESPSHLALLQPWLSAPVVLSGAPHELVSAFNDLCLFSGFFLPRSAISSDCRGLHVKPLRLIPRMIC